MCVCVFMGWNFFSLYRTNVSICLCFCSWSKLLPCTKYMCFTELKKHFACAWIAITQGKKVCIAFAPTHTHKYWLLECWDKYILMLWNLNNTDKIRVTNRKMLSERNITKGWHWKIPCSQLGGNSWNLWKFQKKINNNLIKVTANTHKTSRAKIFL